jgi:prepilin-type processing-associated H-X9-DG protein
LHVPPPVYPGASAQPPRAPSIDYPAPVATRPQAGINKLAVASVVCGAVGLIPIVIPSIVGLILGIMGLRKSANPSVGGRKIAITGIFISALSFVLVFGWLAIVIPQVHQRTEEANRVRCQANLKAIGQALLAYTAQYGAYPPHLEELMISQNLRANLFVCPSSDDAEAPGTDVKTQAQTLSSGAHLSYMYVGQRLNTGMPAARVVVLYEPPANHDHVGSNFLFGDGHVDWLTASQAEQAIPQIQNGINPPKY